VSTDPFRSKLYRWRTLLVEVVTVRAAIIT